MRVLVATGLYPPEIGGPATYAALLESELPKHGCTVFVHAFSTVRKYPTGMRHLMYAWRLFWHAQNADVVLALDPFSVGLPACIVAFLRRKVFVVKMVGDFAWEQARQRFDFDGTLEEFQSADIPLIPLLMRWIERVVTRSAQRVIVPSKYLAAVVRTWGVHEDRIAVIYNGVRVRDVGNKEIIRGVLHFTGKLIISVGRLVPWKGFAKLIETFARLYTKDPELKLFIVGSGPELAHLEARARELHVEHAVIFAGAVDHGALMRYIRAADVFVLNTSYEGFSHLILETMAVGTPVVTTMVGGNPEIIDDGVNGYLVSPNDSDALGKRITKLLSDRALYTRVVQEASKKIAHYTDDRVARETVSLLNLCVS